ncbi:MAG TPA: RcpC/CpaB family pilus assembly protein [Micromonosporaceae bacterium]
MPRRLLAVVVAIVLAVLGTAAVLLYVNRADQRALAGTSPVTVLVAKRHIPAGTSAETIRGSGYADQVTMPKASVPTGEVLSSIPSELDKLVVTTDLQPGQLLLRRMFGPSTQTAGGLAIPDGLMAVSFEAKLEVQVAGYVRPGSQVAVFVRYKVLNNTKTFAGDNGSGNDFRGAGVLIPKAEVIAVGAYGAGGVTTGTQSDGQSSGTAKGSSPSSTQTLLVTLAVNERDAAKIVLANDALYLALLTDSSDVKPGVGADSSNFLE